MKVATEIKRHSSFNLINQTQGIPSLLGRIFWLLISHFVPEIVCYSLFKWFCHWITWPYYVYNRSCQSYYSVCGHDGQRHWLSCLWTVRNPSVVCGHVCEIMCLFLCLFKRERTWCCHPQSEMMSLQTGVLGGGLFSSDWSRCDSSRDVFIFWQQQDLLLTENRAMLQENEQEEYLWLQAPDPTK